MISKKQINEIREYLKKTQNPLFFFDNDADGLCSFLLLRRYINNGKGVVVRGSAELKDKFFSRVNEFQPDYIFVLDIPRLSKEFAKKAEESNIPIIWIDHHKKDQEIPKGVNYYNSCRKLEGEPVSYICYKITQRKQDEWISIVGCISDYYIPEYYKNLKKNYAELFVKKDNPHEIYYKSEIGKVGQILNASLKDKTTNIMKMIRFMYKVKSPYDVLNETKENKTMHDKFNEIDEQRKKIISKFKSKVDKSKKILFFQYSGKTSMSSELANELKINYPKKKIIVAYVSNPYTNISARGNNIRNLMKKAIENLSNSTTGGHEKAVGGRIQTKDLEKFKENLEKIEKTL